MLSDYLAAAMESAQFEVIDDPEPYYGSVPELNGLWATGKTSEECRRNLASALEDWVLFSIARGHPLPAIKGVAIHPPQRVEAL